MKFYITGTKRGLGKALEELYGNCNSLEECDIFINNKHDGFSQVELLYKAARLDKQIINIGSAASDMVKGYKKRFKYGLEKKTLKDANDALFYEGINTTIINFGYFDSPRVSHIKVNKMDISYCVGIVEWVLEQPHRVKDITIIPQC